MPNTDTRRPSFTFNGNPKFILNEVNWAISYKIRIEIEDSTVLWEKELSDLTFVDGFYEFDYPSGKPELTQSISYLLIAEALDNKGVVLKDFKTKVIFLEANAKEKVETFQNLVDQEAPALKNQWLITKRSIANKCEPQDPWPPEERGLSADIVISLD